MKNDIMTAFENLDNGTVGGFIFRYGKQTGLAFDLNGKKTVALSCDPSNGFCDTNGYDENKAFILRLNGIVPVKVIKTLNDATKTDKDEDKAE